MSADLKQDLKFGVAWFLGLFTYDALTCTWAIRRALDKVKHDPSASGLVRDEVLIYVVRMFGAYVLMGLVAAGVLVLLRKAMGGSALRTRWIFAVGVTVWLMLRGMVLWPRMFVGMPGLEWYVANVHPGWLSGAFAAAGLAWAGYRLAKGAGHAGWMLGLLASLGVVSLADAQPPASTVQKNAGPNVLIVGFDALRPDHLDHYGYERNTAPTLDAWLDEARVYDSAFTTLPRTWPAWNSILTGTEPLVHGRRESLPAADATRPRVPMITDALKEAGYHTRFMTDDSRFSYMLPEHNYDVIDQPPVGIRAFALSRYQPYFRVFFTFLNGPMTGWNLVPTYRYNQAFGITWRPKVFAEHVADNIAEAAEHDRFFMTVHACMLHSPADRPWPYHNMYDMGDYRGGNRFKYRSTGSAMADGEEVNSERLEKAERNARANAQNINLYDAGIAMVDETWARIEQAMDEGGLWENTLVIVLSDHGEEFLEENTRYRYRGPNHGYHPWGLGQQRVLMAVKGPGFDAGSTDELASLLDIAPTVAKHVGLDFSTQGRALQDPPEERVLFGETGVSEENYWAKRHKTYPFDRVYKRYRLDEETLRVYQDPDYDEPTALAKDRWAFDGEFWMVEETLEPESRFSLFRWRDDFTFDEEVGRQYFEDYERLKTLLQARPRILPDEDVEAWLRDGPTLPVEISHDDTPDAPEAPDDTDDR